MISLPFATLVWLIGLFWNIQPVPPLNLDGADDPENAQEDHRKAVQKQARNGIIRALLILGGFIWMVIVFLRELDGISAWDGFALLIAIYGGIFLMVQRAEVNRRIATLLILAPIWLILVPRYAAYREWNSESNWAMFAALLLNYLFWVTIGRRYPVGSSQDIVVWGMD